MYCELINPWTSLRT